MFSPFMHAYPPPMAGLGIDRSNGGGLVDMHEWTMALDRLRSYEAQGNETMGLRREMCVRLDEQQAMLQRISQWLQEASQQIGLLYAELQADGGKGGAMETMGPQESMRAWQRMHQQQIHQQRQPFRFNPQQMPTPTASPEGTIAIRASPRHQLDSPPPPSPRPWHPNARQPSLSIRGIIRAPEPLQPRSAPEPPQIPPPPPLPSFASQPAHDRATHDPEDPRRLGVARAECPACAQLISRRTAKTDAAAPTAAPAPPVGPAKSVLELARMFDDKKMWRLLPSFQSSHSPRRSLLDPALRATAIERTVYYLRVLLIGSVMFWVASCHIYGTVYRRSYMVHHTTLDVVDLDRGIVGRNITQSILQRSSNQPPTKPRWRPRTFGNSAEAEEWIRRNGWGAVLINQGASQRLLDASDTYDPKDAITVVSSTGRDPIIVQSYLADELTAAAASAIREFTLRRLREPPSTNNPRLVISPIGYRPKDVAPMGTSLAPVASLLGFLVGVLVTVGPLIEWKLTTEALFVGVRHRDVWLGAAVTVTLWSALIGMYTALALFAFAGPDSSTLTKGLAVGRFFSLWFSSTAVIAATGLWIFNWLLVLTPDLLGVPTLITVVANVGSLMAPVALAPGYFRIIRSLPFFNGALLHRYILSGARPQIAGSVAVLVGEWAAMVAALYCTTWIRQTAMLRGQVDGAGWLRGSIFYSGPVPTRQAAAATRQQLLPADGEELTVADVAGDTGSLKDGDLGV
ncbi:hypothetical protein GGF46_002509 [Coemansia sp. RSA 552]|nr:hypothetical protein GGF46_002509 [Coemansia sp. RSA 552]